MAKQVPTFKFAQGIGTLCGIAVAIYATLLTALAFIGGTDPILNWHFEGGLAQGLLYLFIVEPILITLAYWATILAVSPFLIVHRIVQARRQVRAPLQDSHPDTARQTQLKVQLLSSLRPDESCDSPLFPIALSLLRPGPSEDERFELSSMFAVTNQRIVWTVDEQHSGPFWIDPDAMSLAVQPGAMRLQSTSPPTSTSPETVEFGFEDQATEWVVVGAVQAAWRRHDTSAIDSQRQRRTRFRAVQGTPVQQWTACPSCEKPLENSIERGAQCQGCNAVFTDADTQPVVEERPGTKYPQLISVEPWYAVFSSDIEYQGRTMAWVLFPNDRPMAAPFVIDHVLMEDES